MELQSLYKHVSFLNLDRALDSTSNMDLQCAIRAISIGQIHQTACNPVSGLPISATGSLVLSEVTLELLESKITFKVYGLYCQKLVWIRQRDIDERKERRLALRNSKFKCVIQSTNASSSYHNID